MATQYCVITPSTAIPVSPTTKIVMEIPTGSTAAFTVIGLEIGFTATAAGSCLLEWGTYTTTSSAGYVTVTAQKYGMDQGPSAILGTVKVAPAAPTTSTDATGFAAGTLPSVLITLPGMYSILYPYARELYQPVSQNRCIRLTSTIACNARLGLYFEQ